MCVIVYKPTGVGALSKEWLQNAVDNNPDGWGILAKAKSDNKITVTQGFTDGQFLELGQSYGEDYDVVVHARIATSGGINMQNLHPFPIYGDPMLSPEGMAQPDEEPIAWLFHNGIVKVPEWDKSRSDTWHLARIYEASYGSMLPDKMRKRGWRRRQRRRLGDYNKFVLVSKDSIQIINPNAGLWVDGTWHSNKTAMEEDIRRYCGFGYKEIFEDDSDKIYTANGVWQKDADGLWQLMPHNSAAESAKTFTSSFKTETFQQYKERKEKEEAEEQACLNSLSDGEEWLPKGLDDLDDEDKHLSDVAESVGYEVRKNREMRQHGIIEEWITNSSVDEIEETIYNYDAGTVALGIQYLLDKCGVGPKANRALYKGVM